MNIRQLADDEILIGILGRQDGLYLPGRPGRTWSENPSFGARWRARTSYRAEGVAFIVSGDAAARKSETRKLHELQKAGSLKLFRARSKTVGVTLSEAGDSEARRRCGLPAFTEGLPLLDELYRLKGELGTCYRGFLPETLVVRRRWDGGPVTSARIWDAEVFALPLAVRGLLEFGGDGAYGYYRLTPEGEDLARRREVDGDSLPWTFPELDITPRIEKYIASRRLAFAGIGATSSDSREISEIPIPSQGWEGDFCAKYKAKMVELAGAESASEGEA